MSRTVFAFAFALSLVVISVMQSRMHPRPQEFILSTARLAQTPSGEGQDRPDGPGALLDGSGGQRGVTSYMDYPLGDANGNYFWLELGISHWPVARKLTAHSSPGIVRVSKENSQQRPGESESPLSGDGLLHLKDSIQFEARIPERIRIWNGPCRNSSDAGLEPKKVEASEMAELVKVKDARLDFYYRPLNDPDQDFGYPEATPVKTYHVTIPASAESLDLILDLPVPSESEEYPENMYMILLKFSVLSVQPHTIRKQANYAYESGSADRSNSKAESGPASRSESGSTYESETGNESASESEEHSASSFENQPEMRDSESGSPATATLALCEVEYADRSMEESGDFFVFW